MLYLRNWLNLLKLKFDNQIVTYKANLPIYGIYPQLWRLANS